MKLYIDDSEEGLSRTTCHPSFNTILKDKIYTDIIDEFTPFGNDEGWDTLRNLEEWYMTEYTEDSLILDFITSYGNHNWGWTEKDLPLIQTLDLEEIEKIDEEHEFMLDIFPQIIISVAFGQFKITGVLDDYLKEITQKVIDQQILISNQKIESNAVDLSKLVKVVDGVSTRVNEDGNTNTILIKYIARLSKMKEDLDKIPLIFNNYKN